MHKPSKADPNAIDTSAQNVPTDVLFATSFDEALQGEPALTEPPSDSGEPVPQPPPPDALPPDALPPLPPDPSAYPSGS